MLQFTRCYNGTDRRDKANGEFLKITLGDVSKRVFIENV